MLRLVSALFTHESVATTLPKARAAQIQAEKAITCVKHAYDRLERVEAQERAQMEQLGGPSRAVRTTNVFAQGASRAQSWLVVRDLPLVECCAVV